MIEMRDVSRRFGRVTALENVSFRVEPGEIVALLGPNGAGKTTASRIIGGILAPSEGDAVVAGVSVLADANTVRAKCGFVTDQPALYERMTLRAYLEFFGRLYDIPAPARRAADLAHMLGLADVFGTRLGAFSRGMKQKVAIARALVHDPPVLLLDEPATALDPETARTFRAFIVSLRARHRAILLCTHDLDEAERIADRVIILYRGRVARSGATAELRLSGQPRFIVSFVGDATAATAALARAGVEAAPATRLNGHAALRFSTDDPVRSNPEVLRALLDGGMKVISLVPDERSLEEAYFAIIQEARPRANGGGEAE